MTNSIPLLSSEFPNFSLRYSISDKTVSFILSRFDGFDFHKPRFATDVLERELELTFSRLVDFLEG